jgi:hypothetical protein
MSTKGITKITVLRHVNRFFVHRVIESDLQWCLSLETQKCDKVLLTVFIKVLMKNIDTYLYIIDTNDKVEEPILDTLRFSTT